MLAVVPAPQSEKRTTDVFLAAAFVPILAGVALLSFAPALDLRVVTLALTAGGAAWAAAILRARVRPCSFRSVVAGAVVLRLVAFAAPLPRLSDDVYRNVWEGELILAGISPYTAAPQGPSLGEVRQREPELYQLVNHKDVSAAYPPLVQATGTLAAALARAVDRPPERAGVLTLRVLFALCDLFVLLPLARLLERHGLPRALACAWGWSPLASVEFAGSGHFDSLGILLFVLALDRLAGRAAGAARTPARPLRPVRASLLLTAAGLVKYLPFVALPWAASPRTSGWRAPLLVGALVAIAFAPFLALRTGERGFFDGLFEYGLRWESTNLLHHGIESLCALLLDPTSSGAERDRVARLFAGSAWLAIAAVTWIRCPDPIRGSARLVGAFLLLSPVLHPWYLAWMIPFVALRPALAWLWLIGAAPLSYWPLERWQRDGTWIEPAALWPILALPFLALAAHGWVRARRTNDGAPATDRARLDEAGR